MNSFEFFQSLTASLVIILIVRIVLAIEVESFVQTTRGTFGPAMCILALLSVARLPTKGGSAPASGSLDQFNGLPCALSSASRLAIQDFISSSGSSRLTAFAVGVWTLGVIGL